MTKPLFVGVDVHRKTNTFCLMDGSGGQVVPRFTLDNNRPGTQAFIQQVAELMEAGGLSELQVAAEATGWYWFHFFRSLQEDTLLAQWPVALYALNPRLTARFKTFYVDLDKDDPLYAFTIADRLRFGRDRRPPGFDYDESKVARFAGFKWRKTKSAEFTAEETRLIRTGNPYLRYYFCETAFSVQGCDREYGAYFQRKLKEVRQHAYKRATVLTARELVRLVMRLLATNQPYQPRRL